MYATTEFYFHFFLLKYDRLLEKYKSAEIEVHNLRYEIKSIREENTQLRNENQTLRVENERLTMDNEYLMKTREHKESEISELHEKLEETNSLKVTNISFPKCNELSFFFVSPSVEG